MRRAREGRDRTSSSRFPRRLYAVSTHAGATFVLRHPELFSSKAMGGGGQRPPEWLSTHPASETRANNFRRWMPAAIEMYEQRCGRLS